MHSLHRLYRRWGESAQGSGTLRRSWWKLWRRVGALIAALKVGDPGIDSDFIALLKEIGKKDPLMMSVQEEMFDQLYLGPAFEWASKYGFGLALSYLVIADSFLHSGGMLGFLMNKFEEKKPSDGGEEKRWITITSRNAITG